MQLICEEHPQIKGRSVGLSMVVHHPEVSPEPLVRGESDADADGAEIYGSVIREQGIYRMWYQAWERERPKGNVGTVGCLESDDGYHWKRPIYGVTESCGSRKNHLTDLPFACPSVFIDPNGGDERKYRAFGHLRASYMKECYEHVFKEPGYHSAYSRDGIRWHLESAYPLWPHEDVVTAAWDPYRQHAVVMMKREGVTAGMYRRKFYSVEWADGKSTSPASALIPDELDDIHARAKGFCSADYYGVGLMPAENMTVGFLWTFNHQYP